MEVKKLKKICKYNAVLHLNSGLSIKGNNNDINIGGLDCEVIKNPVTREVYIPGSSVKGKMRSLLELSSDKGVNVQTDKKGQPYADPCRCGICDICRVFGAHKNPNAKSAPTRIIVRDALLTDASREMIQNMPMESGSYLEVKAENSINRATGTANSPRFIERVPAGMEFNLEVVLQIFEGDDEASLKGLIAKGLTILENSYLGGSGSRGYGSISIKDGAWTEV